MMEEKIMLRLISTQLAIFMFLWVTSSPAFAVSEQKVREAADNMGVSTSEARRILQGSFLLIKEIQNNFSTIGSSSYEHNQKIGDNGLINNTIKSFFSSSNATVQVSSVNHGNIISHTIYNYLHRLANRVVFLNHPLQDKLKFHNPAEMKINKSLSSSI
jgi:hypothetical protein